MFLLMCYDFIFCTGKDDKRKYDFCTHIVLDLCETVPHFGNHKLYFDNYFTTIRLEIDLKKLDISSICTVRPNRLSNLNMKDVTDLAREGRGQWIIGSLKSRALSCVQHANIISCFSTLHACLPVESVKRWSTKEKKTYSNKRTKCRKSL